MRFVLTFLAGCLLLLSFAGASGMAAAIPCEASGSEALYHVVGGSDEVPNCPEKGTAHHHHLNCGHQMAAADCVGTLAPRAMSKDVTEFGRHFLPAGLHPAFEPQPPKA